MLSDYTVKKAVPKLVIAVILVNLSWVICQAAITTTNILGDGIGDLIRSVAIPDATNSDFPTFTNMSELGSNFEWQTLIGAGLVGGGIALFTGGVFAALGAIISALAALVLGFLVLMFRRFFIATLVILSPLALVCWAIPGLDKWAKRWWDLFIKLLLMFPFVMAMFGVSDVLAVVLKDTAGNFVGQLMLVFVRFAPFALMPLVFKIAGGAFGTLTGMVNDRGKGLFDRGKSWSKERAGQTNNALTKKAKKDYKLGLKSDRQKGVALDQLKTRSGLRGWADRRGLNEQDLTMLEAERQQHKFRRQSAEAKASDAVRSGHQLDAASDVETFKTAYLADPGNAGKTTKDAQDAALDWIANRARAAAEEGDQDKFNALTSYLAQQKGEKQLNSLQAEAATAGNKKLTTAWTGAVNNQTTYGDLKGYGVHYTAAVHGDMDDKDLNAARAKAINGASMSDRAVMPSSAWTFYEMDDISMGGTGEGSTAKASALEAEILGNDAASAAYKGQRSSKPSYADAYDVGRRNAFDPSRKYDSSELPKDPLAAGNPPVTS